MGHSNYAIDEQQTKIKQWFFKETVRIEHEKQLLEDEKVKVDREKRELNNFKREYERQKALNESQLEREKRLFETKWKILENELREVANEKQKLEREKAFYKEVIAFEQKSDIDAGIFFKGVNSSISLKKRYKELMKIFHPDNVNGDTDTIQLINREYDSLRQAYGV
ncbi:molecular chaperone DnaJ [Anaerosacchariphilus polymeriproducens]|uniref:Molecular chaperone DnaJ n=1 Tax=Anaerosacchariphilus polymeriproducens TaxID=1812858 RepID=A0A371ASC2_9FIRM|nr:molecular chaperone DnaJ [Anaerosacchariphilus polymeriproducens]RDU22461.1 molecular chaperone DnaJ [Anaerosacchariphilus polymeriproducens]